MLDVGQDQVEDEDDELVDAEMGLSSLGRELIAESQEEREGAEEGDEAKDGDSGEATVEDGWKRCETGWRVDHGC